MGSDKRRNVPRNAINTRIARKSHLRAFLCVRRTRGAASGGPKRARAHRPDRTPHHPSSGLQTTWETDTSSRLSHAT